MYNYFNMKNSKSSNLQKESSLAEQYLLSREKCCILQILILLSLLLLNLLSEVSSAVKKKKSTNSRFFLFTLLKAILIYLTYSKSPCLLKFTEMFNKKNIKGKKNFIIVFFSVDLFIFSYFNIEIVMYLNSDVIVQECDFYNFPIKTLSVRNTVLNSSIQNYYRFDVQISLLTDLSRGQRSNVT